MTNAVASYLPECQVITLKPHLNAFCDPKNLRGFIGPSQISFFFHEWLHYLHNVSTLHGLTAFANQVALWEEFRHTIAFDGLSAGSASLPAARSQVIRQQLNYLSGSRAQKQNSLPEVLDVQLLRIVDVRPEVTMLEDLEIGLTSLVCDSEFTHCDGSISRVNLKIGTNELLESLAAMLEAQLVTQLGGHETPAPVVPYHLLTVLARWRAPRLTDREVTCCGLAALQSSDPLGILLSLLDIGEVARDEGKNSLLELRKAATTALTELYVWREKTLARIEAAFPIDEPLARAIKQTVAVFRKNFVERARNPFFEYDVVADLVRDVQRMDNAIKTYGGCSVIQECLGDPDMPNRDFMYEFAFGVPDELLDLGWRKMHASFRFVTLHASKEGFSSTDSLDASRRTRCPFYRVCGYPLRTSAPYVCACTPWKSVALVGKGETTPCWYSEAVHDLRPPAAGVVDETMPIDG